MNVIALINYAAKILGLRKRLGMDQREFAAALGTTQATVSRWEKGKQQPSAYWLRRLAGLAGESLDEFVTDAQSVGADGFVPVMVVGMVKANEWRDSFTFAADQRYRVSIPRIGLPPNVNDLFALEVRGTCMSRRFPVGSLLICRPVGQTPPENGQLVIVVRDKGRKIEQTCRELLVDDQGVAWLWPRSTDPKCQQPYRLDDREIITKITAIVVGAYTPV